MAAKIQYYFTNIQKIMKLVIVWFAFFSNLDYLCTPHLAKMRKCLLVATTIMQFKTRR